MIQDLSMKYPDTVPVGTTEVYSVGPSHLLENEVSLESVGGGAEIIQNEVSPSVL